MLYKSYSPMLFKQRSNKNYTLQSITYTQLEEKKAVEK